MLKQTVTILQMFNVLHRFWERVLVSGTGAILFASFLAALKVPDA
jgi:hypothetical protein